MSTKPSVVITGASTGIGAVYADRFARRGHDLILVARNAGRMEKLAQRLRNETGVSVEVLPADLTNERDLAQVEQRLRQDQSIGILINNAGAAIPGQFLDQGSAQIDQLIALNVVAVTRLAGAAAASFAAAGQGAIVNLSSVVGLAPEMGASVYGATKAYVLFLSQSLAAELAPKGIYVQAVLPAATRTEIWEHAGVDVNSLPGVMEVDELVDAALAGFDRREPVSIPPLHNESQWTAFDMARQTMLPGFMESTAAARYRQAH